MHLVVTPHKLPTKTKKCPSNFLVVASKSAEHHSKLQRVAGLLLEVNTYQGSCWPTQRPGTVQSTRIVQFKRTCCCCYNAAYVISCHAGLQGHFIPLALGGKASRSSANQPQLYRYSRGCQWPGQKHQYVLYKQSETATETTIMQRPYSHWSPRAVAEYCTEQPEREREDFTFQPTN